MEKPALSGVDRNLSKLGLLIVCLFVVEDNDEEGFFCSSVSQEEHNRAIPIKMKLNILVTYIYFFVKLLVNSQGCSTITCIVARC